MLYFWDRKSSNIQEEDGFGKYPLYSHCEETAEAARVVSAATAAAAAAAFAQLPEHTVSNQPTYVQHDRRFDHRLKRELSDHTSGLDSKHRAPCRAGYSVEEREYWPVFEVVTDDHDYKAGQHKHLRCYFKCAFPADVEEAASLHTRRHGYEGGQFIIDIRVPHNFPFAPPVVKFLTKIYHPCVNPNDGTINVDFLQGSWSPAITMTTMVLSIQSLIMSPANLEESCFGLYDVLLLDLKKYRSLALSCKKNGDTVSAKRHFTMYKALQKQYDYLNMKMASAVTLRYAHVHPLNIKHHLHGCSTMEKQQTLWRTIIDYVTHQKLPEVSIMLILSFFPCLPAQLALLFGDGKHNQKDTKNQVSITSHVAVLQIFDHPKDKFYNKLTRITKTISAEDGSEGGEGEGGDY